MCQINIATPTSQLYENQNEQLKCLPARVEYRSRKNNTIALGSQIWTRVFQLLVRTVRSRLSRIYGALGEEEQKAHHLRLAEAIEEDLELRCGGCNESFGLEADSLEALPCSHILHARYCIYATNAPVHARMNLFSTC